MPSSVLSAISDANSMTANYPSSPRSLDPAEDNFSNFESHDYQGQGGEPRNLTTQSAQTLVDYHETEARDLSRLVQELLTISDETQNGANFTGTDHITPPSSPEEQQIEYSAPTLSAERIKEACKVHNINLAQFNGLATSKDVQALMNFVARMQNEYQRVNKGRMHDMWRL